MAELPKLSNITARLAEPEARFESMIKQATGFAPPPGPQSLLLRIQEAFEAGKAPELPTPEAFRAAPKVEEVLAKLPALPALPKLEEIVPKALAGASPSAQEYKLIGGAEKPAAPAEGEYRLI